MLYEEIPSEIRQLAEMTRKVAQEKIAPLIRDLEREKKFSPQLRQILVDAGFMGIVVPEEFGGVHSDLWAESIVLEELGKVFPTAATYLTAHWFSTKLMVRAAQMGSLSTPMLELLERAAQGEALGAIAASEPGVGSDLGGVATKAVLNSQTGTTARVRLRPRRWARLCARGATGLIAPSGGSPCRARFRSAHCPACAAGG